jgi:inorganic pyrophosphatase/exopolyphosphatase/DNA-binding XRE family transcriptional regulator
MNFVTTYPNPDTDGVACVLGVMALKRLQGDDNWSAWLIGKYSAETLKAANLAGVELPPMRAELPEHAGHIIVVDTHHPKQLPERFPFASVVEVLDHHPGGSPDAFPKAIVVNEPLGAAATLVFERFRRASLTPPTAIATMLAAGIFSNTLGFRAPATSARDKKAFEALRAMGAWRDDFSNALTKAAQEELRESADAVIFGDRKILSVQGKDVHIYQVERPGVLDVASIGDLKKELARRETVTGKVNILALVDTLTGRSAILGTRADWIAHIAMQRHGLVDEEGAARFSRIVQRKSDIFPVLAEFPIEPAALPADLLSRPADLGKFIRDRRKQLPLTQNQLAERAGLSRHALSDIETGKSTASIEAKIAALRALGYEPPSTT